MFYRLLYFNKDRVVEYNSMISKEDFTELDEVEITRSCKLGLDAKFAGGEKGDKMSYKGKIHASISRMCNTFIENLSDCDYYVDFIDCDSDINAVAWSTIIRFESEINIPEQFDVISLLNSMPKAYLEDQIVSDIEEDDQDIARLFFRTKNAALPICMEYEGKTICSKLENENFICTYEEFEETLEEGVIVLAKVISPSRSKKKEIFNPLKDFFVLNRAARRAFCSEQDIPKELESIYAEEDYMQLEVLAIYQ